MSGEVVKVRNVGKTVKRLVRKRESSFLGRVISLFNRSYEKVKIVDQLNFSMDDGEFVGLIGLNGAGKTTILKMLAGILMPSEGEIEVIGFKPVDRKKEFLKRLGFVMSNRFQLWSELPVRDSFELHRAIYSIDEGEFSARFERLSKLFMLEPLLDQVAGTMSTGERMRCEIALVLIHTPKLLLLDEPTLGLDVNMQQIIRNGVKDYVKEIGCSVILTSHYMDDVKDLCDRVVLIDKGRKVYDGKLDQLISSYARESLIKVTFTRPPKSNELKSFGKVEKVDDLRYIVQAPRGQVQRVAASIMTNLPVDVLDISEESLADVVRRVLVG